MFCQKCGNEINEGERFCGNCGAPIQWTPVSNPAVQLKKEPKKTGGKAVIVVLTILIIALAGILIYTQLIGGKKNHQKQELPVVSKEDTPTPSKNTEPSEEPEPSEESEEETFDSDEDSELEESLDDDTAVLGDDFENPEEIHQYKIVIDDVTWSEAYNNSIQVKNGYLVHINSEEEMEYIQNQIEREGYGKYIFWLGGRRIGDDNSYYWIDSRRHPNGEELNRKDYWLPGEPSYSDENGLDENCICMFYTSKTNSWVWNDTTNNMIAAVPSYAGRVGYIVEIED